MIHLIQRARGAGLKTLLQVRALDVMRREGYVTARTIADCLEVGVPTAVAVINSLEGRGLADYSLNHKKTCLSREGGEVVESILGKPLANP